MIFKSDAISSYWRIFLGTQNLNFAAFLVKLVIACWCRKTKILANISPFPIFIFQFSILSFKLTAVMTINGRESSIFYLWTVANSIIRNSYLKDQCLWHIPIHYGRSVGLKFITWSTKLFIYFSTKIVIYQRETEIVITACRAIHSVWIHILWLHLTFDIFS